MRRCFSAALAAVLTIAPLFGGSMILEVGNPNANPEAAQKNAVVMARVTACHSPEKTSVVATAEGLVAGKRQTIPLKVINLSTPGMWAVTREWPKEGSWAVNFVATNPDYKDYSPSVVVPVENDSFSWASVKRFYHAPTAAEIAAILAHNGL